MNRTASSWTRLTLVCAFLIATLLGPTAPVAADGGIILTDPQRWAQIEEGQQIAVVRLDAAHSAQVDLFVSMLDRSGESHELVFFVPLGASASDFHVLEESSMVFDRALTEELDKVVRTETFRTHDYRRMVRGSLLLGTLLLNGAWSWPVWIAGALSGCASGAPPPLATFETESSQVSIYATDGQTDLQALIETTGLDPSVRETLSRLRGQQIAVVQMQTQPPLEQPGGGRRPVGQPGIHLSWRTTLAEEEGGPTYAYPFGTGSSWAHPIELTRVYVVAAPGVDFRVKYPELGSDLSGYAGRGLFGVPLTRIERANVPAYAVENAVGTFGRIWRVTYLKSNSAEDVVITRLAELTPETRAVLRQLPWREPIMATTWLVSLLVALAVWVTTWRLMMPRLLGVTYPWRDKRLWQHALGAALLNPVTNPLSMWVALAFALFSVSATRGVILVWLVVLLLGLVSLWAFVRVFAQRLGTERRRTALAYLAVLAVANIAYLSFSLVYAAVAGAL